MSIMKTDLISEKALAKLHGESIREQISNMVVSIKKNFKTVPFEIRQYNIEMAEMLKNKWKEEVKKLPKQKAIARLESLKELSKEFRLFALNKIADDWYHRLWMLRSEIALITSIYDLSGLNTIPEFNNWQPKNYPKFNPVVLRMNGPRKPKKEFYVKDIKYNVDEAFLKMMKPLEDWIDITQKHISKLTGLKKELDTKGKISRFRKSLLAREYITVCCQAIAPRQSAINKKE